MDPLSDKFVHLSPYNYASNNPVTNIDLWGLQGIGFHQLNVWNACKDDPVATKAFDDANYKTAKGGLIVLKTVVEAAILILAPEIGVPLALSDASNAPVLPAPQAWATAVTSTAEVAATRMESTTSEVSQVSKATYLYRGDSRAPSNVFKEGFTSKGNDMDLLNYAKNNPSNGGYISTSKSPTVARTFADQGGYVYTIKNAQGVDVNAALGKSSPYPAEAEVAIPLRLPTENIQGARQVGNNGYFTGPYIKNPNAR